MADIMISELPAASAVLPADLLTIVQGGVTNRTTIEALLTLTLAEAEDWALGLATGGTTTTEAYTTTNNTPDTIDVVSSAFFAPGSILTLVDGVKVRTVVLTSKTLTSLTFQPIAGPPAGDSANGTIMAIGTTVSTAGSQGWISPTPTVITALAAPYNIAAGAVLLVKLSAVAASAIVLPTDPVNGARFIIKDGAANFGTYNVLVNCGGTNKIEGTVETSMLLNASRMEVDLMFESSTGIFWLM